MNITVEIRHMEGSNSLREYVESKVSKLPRYLDSIQSIEVILDREGGLAASEIIAHVNRKAPFVASSRNEDMYASVDLCMDKISEQLRRHKDKIRDRKGSSDTI